MAIWDGKPWFIPLVKDVLEPSKEILKTLASMPRPTLDNVKFKNSKALVLLRDWFLAHETNRTHGGYAKMYDGIFNVAIIKNETDTTYQVRIEEVLKQVLKMLEADMFEFPERPRHKEQHWTFDGVDVV